MNPGSAKRSNETAQRQLAGDERQVEGEAGVRAGRAAVGQREEVAAQRQRAAFRVRAARQVAHRTGQRAGAVQRPLRSEQHLDPLDVVQPEVDRERDVAEVGRDPVVVVVARRLRAVQRVGVQAAHDDHVAAPRPLVDYRETGRPARQLRQVVDGPPLDVGPGDRRDAHRDLLQRLLDAGRGNDHRLVERRQSQGDARQLHQVGGDLDTVHGHLSEAAQEDRHRVHARRNAAEREPARGVGHRGTRTLRDADQRDGRTGEHPAGRVDDDAGDLSALRRGGRRRDDSQAEYDETARRRVSRHPTRPGHRKRTAASAANTATGNPDSVDGHGRCHFVAPCTRWEAQLVAARCSTSSDKPTAVTPLGRGQRSVPP